MEALDRSDARLHASQGSLVSSLHLTELNGATPNKGHRRNGKLTFRDGEEREAGGANKQEIVRRGDSEPLSAKELLSLSSVHKGRVDVTSPPYSSGAMNVSKHRTSLPPSFAAPTGGSSGRRRSLTRGDSVPTTPTRQGGGSLPRSMAADGEPNPKPPRVVVGGGSSSSRLKRVSSARGPGDDPRFSSRPSSFFISPSKSQSASPLKPNAVGSAIRLNSTPRVEREGPAEAPLVTRPVPLFLSANTKVQEEKAGPPTSNTPLMHRSTMKRLVEMYYSGDSGATTLGGVSSSASLQRSGEEVSPMLPKGSLESMISSTSASSVEVLLSTLAENALRMDHDSSMQPLQRSPDGEEAREEVFRDSAPAEGLLASQKNATEELAGLCMATGYHPSEDEVRDCIQRGADPLAKASPSAVSPMLHRLIVTSRLKVLRACLETPLALDFTTTDDSGRTPLHIIFDMFGFTFYAADEKEREVILRKQRAIVAALLTAILERLETHPRDIVDWSLKDHREYDFLSLAAMRGQLSVVWPILLEHKVEYFMGLEEPIPVATKLLRTDIAQLPMEQRVFIEEGEWRSPLALASLSLLAVGLVSKVVQKVRVNR